MPAAGRIPDDLDNGPRSGIVHAALSFANEFALRSNDVRLTGWAPDRPRHERTRDGVTVNTHPGYSFAHWQRWDLTWLAPMALHSVVRSRPEILHVHADPNLLRLRGELRVFHLHSLMPDEVSQAYLTLTSRADAVVCCSEAVQSGFLAATGRDEKFTYVVYNGTDTDQFRPASTTERAQARDRLQLDQTAVVVAFAGAFNWEKGLVHLLRAFPAVRQHVPNAVLAIAGGWLWGTGPGSRSRTNGLLEIPEEPTDGVQMFGALPHKLMPTFMQSADILVLPSLRDAFPLVALDGMASGLPIIASNVGGLPEIVANEQTGILVPPADDAALESAITRLARDDGLRLRMGKVGRSRSLEFTWERSVSSMQRVYDALLHQRELN